MGQVLQSGSIDTSAILTTLKSAPGQDVFGNGLYRVFASSGTFVVPPDIKKLRVTVVGGGGGGQGIGAGGGGGGLANGGSGGQGLVIVEW